MSGVSIKILGGANEVGCTSIRIHYKGESILLDYGTKPSNKFVKPPDPDTDNIRSIVLSHAHVDHSGAIPYLYKSVLKPILITTPLTMELSNMLIRDMMKILKHDVPFTNYEIERMKNSHIPITYERPVKIGDNFIVTLFNAGHIPGSASILVEVNDKKIWYTGDINLIETHLLPPANIYNEADIVLMETTYADRDHPDRKEEEKRLVKRVKEIVEDRGIVLIPSFSVGRSQEILTILHEGGYRGPLAMDGMAKTATEIILRHPEYLKSPEILEDALKRVKWIRNNVERKKLLRKPGVVIAPAGMLGGGWAEWYLKQIYKDDKNGLFFVSYQVPGTMGHRILNEKTVWFNGKEEHISAQIEQFELSGHSGRGELLEIVKKLNNPEVIMLMHGEETAIRKFKGEVESMGLNVLATNPNEEYIF